MRILIVEDDFVSRRILQAFLTPYGLCEIAVNGAEALAAFKMALEEQDPYTLICLDIMIPEMDGHQVLKEIRGLENEMGIIGKSSVKIVMTTAINDPRIIMNSFKEQCEGYLVKPIERERLILTLKDIGLIL